jgi:hypothetical protein
MRRRSDCCVDWQLPDEPVEVDRRRRRAVDAEPSAPPEELPDDNVTSRPRALGDRQPVASTYQGRNSPRLAVADLRTDSTTPPVFASS